MTPTLAFIVVSYNTRELLDACLTSIRQCTRGVSFEIVVVDNASADGSAALVRERHPEAIVVESPTNLGFGRANNVGFRHTRAPFVLLLNSDAVLLEDTGTALVRFLARTPTAGIAGPGVILTTGERQPKTCGLLPTARVIANQSLFLNRLFPRSRSFAGLYLERLPAAETPVGWVSGVCAILRREVYHEIGGFDPTIFMYAEDIDLCARASGHGWETWRLESHAVRHLCGGSTRTAADYARLRVLQQRNLLRLLDRVSGPGGRVLARASLGAGLLLRLAVRGAAALPRSAGRQRRAWRGDWGCFADFFASARGHGKDGCAHRT